MIDGTDAPVAPEGSGTSAAPAPVSDSGSGLDGDWQDLLGDSYTASADTDDETPQGEAGQPPAASGDSAGPEGEATAEHAGQPPADAASDAPDSGSEPEYQPFTYTVNGETKTADGFYRTADGVVVDNDKAEWLMQRLSQAEHYFAKDQESSQRYQALNDAFTKLTSWNVKDAQGNTRTLLGADAIEAQRVQLGRALAENAALNAALRDPVQLAELVTAQQGQDGQWYIVPNERGLATLSVRLDRDGMRVEQLARQNMQQIRGQLRAQPTQAQPTSFAPNEQQIAQTVDQAANVLGVTNLTAEDKAHLAKQLPRYIRDAANEQERAQFGAKVLDGDFRLLVQNQSNLRAALAKTATAATQATQQNAARIAAANVGKRPAQAPPNTPTRAPNARDTAQADAWDRRERAAAAALTSNRRSA